MGAPTMPLCSRYLRACSFTLPPSNTCHTGYSLQNRRYFFQFFWRAKASEKWARSCAFPCRACLAVLARIALWDFACLLLVLNPAWPRVKYLTAPDAASGGVPENSRWGCAARFSKSWPKKCHFPLPFSDHTSKIHTRFQTWPLGRNFVIIT